MACKPGSSMPMSKGKGKAKGKAPKKGAKPNSFAKKGGK